MSTEFHPLTISSVERLTKDAVAVSFDVPESLREEYQYIQGQHLTLKADIDGEDVRRSYSICHSAQSQKLTVGIKRIETGVFSNFANEKLEKGMTLEVMPPQGHFYTEVDGGNNKHYLMVAVGSGITPMLSHIETILEAEPNSIVTLIYGNKSTPLMMFREKLCFLKNKFITRLHWINLFTREENDAELFNGRISAQKLIDLHAAKMVDLDGVDEVFLCGPETMINEVNEFFKANNKPTENIHYELFFAGSAEESAHEKQAERVEKYGEKIAKVSVKVAGRKTLLDLAMGGDNILDAAMENGADLPFSCKGGVCATCKAKVVKGKVEMDMNHSLTPQEVEEGMILTCQSHPISDEVEVDFDLAN
ncbi:MAG: phenylacetate-CoA oxygenase/reductase subunit PaaK [Kangiellaceae bacterium]|nr:phenylacetate-CoA oxygenase/reductase subunit PaaK [Kangiellaceae bacterium]MCW9000373.1 phenylacetate-CoA oxygenase/reductase subunit PaaK [Kangiellaceae bacterium]